MATFLDMNDNVVELNNLYNDFAGDFVNDATVTVTIKDLEGNVLFNSAMDYVSGSDGKYRVLVPAELDLGDAGDEVTVEVLAIGGDGSTYKSGPEIAYIRNRGLCG